MAAPALPPPPERDQNTISSIKRTLCASLLIWVSTPQDQRPRVKRRVAASVAATCVSTGLAAVAVANRLGVLPLFWPF
jgi:hypothetical protein